MLRVFILLTSFICAININILDVKNNDEVIGVLESKNKTILYGKIITKKINNDFFSEIIWYKATVNNKTYLLKRLLRSIKIGSKNLTNNTLSLSKIYKEEYNQNFAQPLKANSRKTHEISRGLQIHIPDFNIPQLFKKKKQSENDFGSQNNSNTKNIESLVDKQQLKESQNIKHLLNEQKTKEPQNIESLIDKQNIKKPKNTKILKKKQKVNNPQNIPVNQSTKQEKVDTEILELDVINKLEADKSTDAIKDLNRDRSIIGSCEPKIDILDESIIFYKIDDKDNCNDISQKYSLRKDFDCPNCIPNLDLENLIYRKKYSYYYLDKKGNKVVLDNKSYEDSKIHELSKSLSSQDPAVNYSDNTISPLFNINDSDGKLVKRNTRLKQYTNLPLKISEDCKMLHDFDEKQSIKLYKSLYKIDGNEIEFMPCGFKQKKLVHEFDYESCEHNIIEYKKELVEFAKVYIEHNGERIYLSNCIPIGKPKSIINTCKGCDDMFNHDFSNMKSYKYKRWVLKNDENIEVDECRVSLEFLPHINKIIEYVHNDEKKQSIPVTYTYIINNGNEEILKESAINYDLEPIKYYFLEYKDVEDSISYIGCTIVKTYKRYSKYKRVDDSIFISSKYEIIISKSENQCEEDTENKIFYKFTEMRNGDSFTGPVKGKVFDDKDHCLTDTDFYRRYYENKVRTKKTYPEGRIEYTPWKIKGDMFYK